MIPLNLEHTAALHMSQRNNSENSQKWPKDLWTFCGKIDHRKEGNVCRIRKTQESEEQEAKTVNQTEEEK